MNKKQIVFTAFLLIGQAAFLLATIDHVAYYFSAFDHSNIFVPYGIAVSIDGFIALMSYAIIDMSNHHIRWYKILPVSIVVAVLSLLSIYINGVYNRHFEAMGMLSGVDTISIPVFGDINSLIASCFSFLILAYTFVGNALASTEVGETLEERASRLETEKEAKERISKATEGRISSKIKKAITATSDVTTHAMQSFKTPLQSSQEGQETPLQGASGIIAPSEEMKPLETTTEKLVIAEVVPSSKNGHNISLDHLATRKRK